MAYATVKPEPRALADFFRREERIEDLVLHVGRHAGSVVADLQDDGVAIAVMPCPQRPASPRPFAESIACSALMTRFSSTC